MTENTAKKSVLQIWIMAVRAYAFPASVIPVIYGSLIAVIHKDISFNFFHFFLTLIGAMLVHVGANLVNDIYDYKKGIDKKDEEIGIPHGGSMVLSLGLMSIKQMKAGSVIVFAVSGAIGLYLWSVAGVLILYLMIFGLFCAFFYTAAPLQLKYKALGDIMVFLAFGTGMTLGAYYVQVKEFSWVPVILSIPFGFLIDAILHSNNIRDINFDGAFGVKTIPILIGEKLSRYFYYFLVIGAYLSIIIFIVTELLPWLALLNLVTLPTAIKLIKMVNDIPPSGIPRWEFGTKHNVMTAQFNMQFGLTLTAGILISYIISLL